MAHKPPLCDHVHPLLGEYLRRRLPAGLLVEIRHHLAVCPECAATFEEERAFSVLVGAMDEPPPTQLLSGVMARVRAEPCVLPAFRVHPLDVLFALVATVALVGIVFGFVSLSVIIPAIVGVIAESVPLNRAFVGTLAAVFIWSLLGLAVVALATAGTRRALTRRFPIPQ